MGITIETIQTDRFRMDYFRFGTAGAQPVVILPGLSVISVMTFADSIAQAYRKLWDFDVYLLDRRSDLPSEYSVADMARDTGEALDALSLREAYVIGISQGGMIAQALAMERPELVGRMVLGSTAARVTESVGAVIRSWISLAKSRAVDELMEAFAQAIYTEDFYRRNRKAYVALGRLVPEESLRRFIILAEGTDGFDVYDGLEGIRCPVLVLGARNDRVLGWEASREIADKLGCELFIYENYGHAVYDEAPDYLDRVSRFFPPSDR